METIVERHGRFELIQFETGFCWRLTTPGSDKWYWHPETGMWTPNCQPSPTQEEATIKLDWTLAHEDAGDLNKQDGRAPPTRQDVPQG